MHIYLLLVSHDDPVPNVHFLLLHNLVFLFLSLDLLGHLLALQVRLLVEIHERFLLLLFGFLKGAVSIVQLGLVFNGATRNQGSGFPLSYWIGTFQIVRCFCPEERLGYSLLGHRDVDIRSLRILVAHFPLTHGCQGPRSRIIFLVG